MAVERDRHGIDRWARSRGTAGRWRGWASVLSGRGVALPGTGGRGSGRGREFLWVSFRVLFAIGGGPRRQMG